MNSAAIRGRYLSTATIIGRRINSRGHREDYNKDVKLVQCLEVRGQEKMTCLTTVEKDGVITNAPKGRYVDIYNRDDIWWRNLLNRKNEHIWQLNGKAHANSKMTELYGDLFILYSNRLT